MHLNTTYSERFRWVLLSADGYTYRLELRRAGYDAVNPSGRPPRRDVVGDGLSVAWAGAGGSEIGFLAPVAASELRVSLVDNEGGLAGEVAGSPDGAWSGALYRCDPAGGPTLDGRQMGEPSTRDALEWLGYLFSARRDEREILPGLTGTSLSFTDGLGLLSGTPFTGPGAVTPDATGADLVGFTPWEPALRSILRVLGPLGGGGTSGPAGAYGRAIPPGTNPATSALTAPTWTDVKTAVRWWPRVAEAFGAGGYTQLPPSVDPAAYILTRAKAWMTANQAGGTGESDSAGDALRAIVHRLSARLYQSGGVWRLDQRSALARTPTAVPVHSYPATAGDLGEHAYEATPGAEVFAVATTPEDWGYDPTPTAATPEDRIVDTWVGPVTAQPAGLFVLTGDARSSALPVRTAESTYAHGALGNLVPNGSFEDRRPGGDEYTADGWFLTGAAQRQEMTPALYPGFDASAGNRHVLRLPRTDGAVQSIASVDLPPLAGTDRGVLRVRLTAAFPYVASNSNTERANNTFFKLSGLSTGDVLLSTAPFTVTLTSAAIQGKDVWVYVKTDAGGVPGRPLLPVGAVLYFSPAPFVYAEGRITLTAPFAAGDGQLRADVEYLRGVEVPLPAGQFAQALQWIPVSVENGIGEYVRSPALAETVTDGGATTLKAEAEAFAADLTMVAADGSLVDGAVRLLVKGPDAGGNLYGIIDGVEARYEISAGAASGDGTGDRTQEPTETTGRATRPQGTTGTDASLPVSGATAGRGYPVGDGPLADSDGGLLVYATRPGAFLDLVPTAASAVGGGAWQAEPWAGTEPDTDGASIDGLAAAEALAQAGWRDTVTGATGPLARVSQTFLLRAAPGVPAALLRPHHVRRYWVPAALVSSATAGETAVLLTKPARPGEYVRLPSVSPAPYQALRELPTVALEVLSVSGGAGGWLCTLASPVPASIPGRSPCAVSVLGWWDQTTWDVYGGAVTDEGTELSTPGAHPETDFLTQTALSV